MSSIVLNLPTRRSANKYSPTLKHSHKYEYLKKEVMCIRRRVHPRALLKHFVGSPYSVVSYILGSLFVVRNVPLVWVCGGRARTSKVIQTTFARDLGYGSSLCNFPSSAGVGWPKLCQRTARKEGFVCANVLWPHRLLSNGCCLNEVVFLKPSSILKHTHTHIHLTKQFRRCPTPTALTYKQPSPPTH